MAVKIGIIGGSGLENPEILMNPEVISLTTPFGSPSSDIMQGRIKNKEVFILSRHGKHHTIPPTQVNNKANIYALKQLGCTHIITTTACGSLREEIKRGDFVILDQFIDFTRHREVTFFNSFEKGNMHHTPMANPFSEYLRQILIHCARELNIPFHTKGTVITIEGPRFSTRAESNMFRLWGADVINMSVAPEAILANELALPYASIAISTDYDCWKLDEAPVTWEEVLHIFQQNVNKVLQLLQLGIEQIEE